MTTYVHTYKTISVMKVLSTKYICTVIPPPLAPGRIISFLKENSWRKWSSGFE